MSKKSKPDWVKNAIPDYGWKDREDYQPRNRGSIWSAMQKKLTELDMKDFKQLRPDKKMIADIIISINKTATDGK